MSSAERAYVRSLLQLALEDLAASERLIGSIDRQAAYHLAQCVEELARAVVAHRTGKRLGRLHQIATIAGNLPLNDRWRNELVDFDAVYTRASTAMRCPHETTDAVSPPPRTLRDDLARGRALANEIVAEIAPDLMK